MELFARGFLGWGLMFLLIAVYGDIIELIRVITYKERSFKAQVSEQGLTIKVVATIILAIMFQMI